MISSRKKSKESGEYTSTRRADDVINFSLSPPSKLKDDREKTTIDASPPLSWPIEHCRIRLCPLQHCASIDVYNIHTSYPRPSSALLKELKVPSQFSSGVTIYYLNLADFPNI
jgi:hypothetical protein